jgi:hypothetical protein
MKIILYEPHIIDGAVHFKRCAKLEMEKVFGPMKPSPLEAQVDAQIDWIEAENAALERDIAALAALAGDARAQATAAVERRLPVLQAAIARCDAAIEMLERDEAD